VIVDLEIRCEDCPLWKRPYVPSDGSTKPKVMAIGTAPGATEEQIRAPFSGDIGSIVREVLQGIVGDDAYYTNLIKRRPVDDQGKSRKPTKKECSHCGGKHLSEEIHAFKAPVIVTFGHLPTAFVLGRDDISMDQLHGLPIQLVRFGYTFTLLPTYDPGYVARKGGLTSDTGDAWIKDIQELRNFVQQD
jgi:uracil-DNA glycosylase family 4